MFLFPMPGTSTQMVFWVAVAVVFVLFFLKRLQDRSRLAVPVALAPMGIYVDDDDADDDRDADDEDVEDEPFARGLPVPVVLNEWVAPATVRAPAPTPEHIAPRSGFAAVAAPRPSHAHTNVVAGPARRPVPLDAFAPLAPRRPLAALTPRAPTPPLAPVAPGGSRPWL